jgi:hypothetical protein
MQSVLQRQLPHHTAGAKQVMQVCAGSAQRVHLIHVKCPSRSCSSSTGSWLWAAHAMTRAFHHQYHITQSSHSINTRELSLFHTIGM